ncbi:hypothetical protein FA13DRAFT_1714678 [Coprinellus micaceus]|uniref:Uncharacterized protein n=1 Tax=Coprinellus micaceus TaxID=71717 RepID=A0A4Y7SRU5_COPMI|nr:hypothetical protein FA13DRAFT_1714678 [Coprinellus micaceus]
MSSFSWQRSALALARPGMREVEYGYWLLRISIAEELNQWPSGGGPATTLQELKGHLMACLETVHREIKSTTNFPSEGLQSLAFDIRPVHTAARMLYATEVALQSEAPISVQTALRSCLCLRVLYEVGYVASGDLDAAQRHYSLRIARGPRWRPSRLYSYTYRTQTYRIGSCALGTRYDHIATVGDNRLLCQSTTLHTSSPLEGLTPFVSAGTGQLLCTFSLHASASVLMLPGYTTPVELALWLWDRESNHGRLADASDDGRSGISLFIATWIMQDDDMKQVAVDQVARIGPPNLFQLLNYWSSLPISTSTSIHRSVMTE